MIKPTQQELKQAYQIVSQDLVHNLAKIKDGEGIRLNNFGTFVKTPALCIGLYFYGSAAKQNSYLKHLPTIGGLAFGLNTLPNNQNQTQPNSPAQPPFSSGLMQIVGAVLPALLEHFTGQKMNTNGNGAEMQLVFSQLLNVQQQILTTQQAFNQRLTALESNASQQLNNLTQQVQSIKSIRLSQEKKQIDFNLQSENESNQY
ncbi:15550_t:CDS:2 [Funneliformis geosporum]|uniref:15550_t:CDS:1 n=1 Tax=Funneliformis geosporum TaxID=1117311 RepID=A0A9W4WZ59_9GLOM|nr:15550_t:CDS:2 [Funneliformis geosporum]